MSTAYSIDLRQKIILALENNSLQRNVAKRFKVSLRTVQRYWKQYQQTHNITPKPFHNNADKIKIDSNKIIDFIEQNKNITLKEIAVKMGVTFVAIHYVIKQNGYSFKKKAGYIKKEMKKNVKNFKKKL